MLASQAGSTGCELTTYTTMPCSLLARMLPPILTAACLALRQRVLPSTSSPQRDDVSFCSRLVETRQPPAAFPRLRLIITVPAQNSTRRSAVPARRRTHWRLGRLTRSGVRTRLPLARRTAAALLPTYCNSAWRHVRLCCMDSWALSGTGRIFYHAACGRNLGKTLAPAPPSAVSTRDKTLSGTAAALPHLFATSPRGLAACYFARPSLLAHLNSRLHHYTTPSFLRYAAASCSAIWHFPYRCITHFDTCLHCRSAAGVAGWRTRCCAPRAVCIALKLVSVIAHKHSVAKTKREQTRGIYWHGVGTNEHRARRARL